MKIGSLFSGIGGLELGLEWAGLGPVLFQVERDPFCRSVLAKHWPSAERFDDVCAVGSHCLAAVDIICGGFPCQDLSYAGKGAGLAGERSGLWREYARIVRELRPRFVVVENVSALLARGLGDVLGDLAALGYDAEWHCVRASDVGAPHRRERLFVVAYAAGRHAIGGSEPVGASAERAACPKDGERLWAEPSGDGGKSPLAHPIGREPERAGEPGDVAGEARGEGDERQRVRHAARGGGETVAHAERIRLDRDGAEPNAGATRGARSGTEGQESEAGGASKAAGDDGRGGLSQSGLGLSAHGLPGRVARWPAGPGEAQNPWEAPRTIGRCDNRAARLKALGNAVVPQVAEVIGGIVMRIARRLEAS